MVRTMSGMQKRLLSPLTKFKRFMFLFLRNRRGLIGLLIIIGFGVLALGAPLFTPYDPVHGYYVSGSYSAPGWIEQLPTALGGLPGASHNLELENNSKFDNGLTEWNLAADPHISVSYSDLSFDDVGGSANVTFSRNETGTSYGNVSAIFYQDFYFPYEGLPRKLMANVTMSADGTNHVGIQTVENVTWTHESPRRNYNATQATIKIAVPGELDTNITIFMFIQRMSDGKVFLLWPFQPERANGLDLLVNGLQAPTGYKIPTPGTIYRLTENVTENATERTWIDSSVFGIDTDYIQYPTLPNDATRAIFENKGAIPGNFRIGINMTFNDVGFSNKTIETSLNIDNFGLEFEGRVWGILGTDNHGVDLWAQLVYGARISLYVGLLASVIGVVIGLIVGLAAGYMGRYVDEFLMRFSDMLLVIPTLPLLIVLVAVLGPALENLIILIGFLGWMGFARLVRSQVLSLRERPFVEAAKAVGAGKTHIMTKHILPNVVSLVYVSLATSVPGAIVSEAALSFLGFYDPTKISWGRMLYEAQASGGVQYWWWTIPPGLCIAALAIAFVLLGFALDEVFNPRLRMRK
jgi:ABC-type dipeptide/oligopeptide/nickel transport system permease subunit